MRKLALNMMILCIIAAVLYVMDLVSGLIILWVLLPILALFMLLTALLTFKQYKRLVEEEKKKSSV